jgi:outer membrane protein insertion porin family
LLNRPFTRTGTRTAAEISLLPVLRKYGHLRAAVGLPQVETDSACKSDVAVKMVLEPGAAYVWDKVVWTGNKAFTTEALNSLLAMQPGEIANGLKLDAGLGAVLRAYGKQGYAGLQWQPLPEFNEAGKKISLKITIDDGTPFQMGTFSVVGLSEKITGMFKELWRIKPGEVYDTTYLGDFLKRLVDVGGIPPEQVNRIKTVVKPDKEKRTVDVILDFKGIL